MQSLFLVNFSLLVFVLTTVVKTPEGIVIGFRNFAWAPN
jgi:hypothetical protein